MATWDLFKLSAKKAARAAIKETGEAADIASLHIKLKALEAKRNEEYEMLGRLTYRQLKTGISQAERIAPVINSLDTIREKIKAVSAEMDGVIKAREARRAKERAAKLEFDESEAMLDEIAEEVNSDDADDDVEDDDEE